MGGVRAGKRRAEVNEWRNGVRNLRPARRVPRGSRKEPNVFKYVVPVLRAVTRALWKYLNHR